MRYGPPYSTCTKICSPSVSYFSCTYMLPRCHIFLCMFISISAAVMEKIQGITINCEYTSALFLISSCQKANGTLLHSMYESLVPQRFESSATLLKPHLYNKKKQMGGGGGGRRRFVAGNKTDFDKKFAQHFRRGSCTTLKEWNG